MDEDFEKHKLTDSDTFSFAKERLEIMQFEEEALWTLSCVRNHLPSPANVVLEIGSGRGGMLCMLSRLLYSDGLLVSISLNKLPPTGCSPHLPYKPLEVDIVRQFVSPIEFVHIDDDSRSPDTFDALVETLGGERISALFIDGDHGYESTKSDFEMYSMLVTVPGVIFFHDVKTSIWGASRFWADLKESGKFKCDELSCRTANPRGIGVVYI